jgi:hypothetical protein
MPYIFNNTDGSRSTTVPDGLVDASTYSLALIGRNVSNFGQFFAQNTVRHLENFASATAPTPATVLTGQLWYDKTENLLRVYDGSAWKRATNIVVGTSIPVSPSAGTAFFNTVDNKLRIYDGSSFKVASYAGEVSSAYSGTAGIGIGSPTNYGTRIRNIFLKDTLNIDRAVLALTYVNDSANGSVNQGTTTTDIGKETIMAIFSDHAQFAVNMAGLSSTEGESVNWAIELAGTDGIGTTIRPGLNLRREYDATELALASRSLRSDAAYVLNTGSFGSDSGNIPASDVIHVGSSYIPSATNNFTLGSSSSRFADLHTGIAYIGNGTNGAIFTAGNVAIGNTSNRISTIHTTQFNVSGNISFATGTATDAVTTSTPNTLVLRDASGNFSANVITATATTARYADLAEIYSSDQEYQPGTVVKLGGTAEITSTTSFADTQVFGVVSTDPAYLMNSNADGLPVALAGRVPVKVIGKVLKGQRLVSSDQPGYACAASDDVNILAIIGRSLQNKLTDNDGVIEAVIGIK